jgi:hypothetical protein
MTDPGRADAEVPLAAWGSGTQPSRARRRADVVYREAGPWSGTVLALLRYLEQAGFAGAPRVIGSGLSADGREMVSYVPGMSPHPDDDDEDAVAGVGTLLASLHAAAATFVPPPGAVWKPWFGRELPGPAPVIGHGDTGPWNIVARDGRPVALIDFEFAGPVGAEWDLAQAAWLNAQLHDSARAEAADARVTPQTTTGSPAPGTRSRGRSPGGSAAHPGCSRTGHSSRGRSADPTRTRADPAAGSRPEERALMPRSRGSELVTAGRRLLRGGRLGRPIGLVLVGRRAPLTAPFR